MLLSDGVAISNSLIHDVMKLWKKERHLVSDDQNEIAGSV
jgi:hypothetical protein